MQHVALCIHVLAQDYYFTDQALSKDVSYTTITMGHDSGSGGYCSSPSLYLHDWVIHDMSVLQL